MDLKLKHLRNRKAEMKQDPEPIPKFDTHSETANTYSNACDLTRNIPMTESKLHLAADLYIRMKLKERAAQIEKYLQRHLDAVDIGWVSEYLTEGEDRAIEIIRKQAEESKYGVSTDDS